MKIVQATLQNLLPLTILAHQLWPEHSFSNLQNELTQLLETNVFFLAYDKTNSPVGFCQVSLRHDYVEGTSTSPIGYLEGIFVLENERHKNIGKELLLTAENWAKEKGCREFASDTSLENDTSQSFHEALGFTNKTILVHYSKRI